MNKIPTEHRERYEKCFKFFKKTYLKIGPIFETLNAFGSTLYSVNNYDKKVVRHLKLCTICFEPISNVNHFYLHFNKYHKNKSRWIRTKNNNTMRELGIGMIDFKKY